LTDTASRLLPSQELSVTSTSLTADIIVKKKEWLNITGTKSTFPQEFTDFKQGSHGTKKFTFWVKSWKISPFLRKFTTIFAKNLQTSPHLLD
jgi:hypothetical protein